MSSRIEKLYALCPSCEQEDPSAGIRRCFSGPRGTEDHWCLPCLYADALDGWKKAEERIELLQDEDKGVIGRDKYLRLRDAARMFLNSWNEATQPSEPDGGRDQAAVRNMDAAVALRAELENSDEA